jgi:hypothetical protein
VVARTRINIGTTTSNYRFQKVTAANKPEAVPQYLFDRISELAISCSLAIKTRKITVSGNSPTLIVPKSGI